MMVMVVAFFHSVTKCSPLWLHWARAVFHCTTTEGERKEAAEAVHSCEVSCEVSCEETGDADHSCEVSRGEQRKLEVAGARPTSSSGTHASFMWWVVLSRGWRYMSSFMIFKHF